MLKLTTGADAINISGLLNPKKLGNFIECNEKISSLDSYFLEI